jgi:hypothetical protein
MTILFIVPAREEQFLDPGQVMKILFTSPQAFGLQVLFESCIFNVSWLQHMRWHLMNVTRNSLHISTDGILRFGLF